MGVNFCAGSRLHCMDTHITCVHNVSKNTSASVLSLVCKPMLTMILKKKKKKEKALNTSKYILLKTRLTVPANILPLIQKGALSMLTKMLHERTHESISSVTLIIHLQVLKHSKLNQILSANDCQFHRTNSISHSKR